MKLIPHIRGVLSNCQNQHEADPSSLELQAEFSQARFREAYSKS